MLFPLPFRPHKRKQKLVHWKAISISEAISVQKRNVQDHGSRNQFMLMIFRGGALLLYQICCVSGITKPRNTGTPEHRKSYFFQLFFLEPVSTSCLFSINLFGGLILFQMHFFLKYNKSIPCSYSGFLM